MDRSMMSSGTNQHNVSVSGRSIGANSTPGGRRMKMAYEYARITQVYTLSSSQLPKCWVYPVSLLVHAYSS